MDPQLASAIRTLLCTIGGAMATKGIIDSALVEAIVGAAMPVISLIWSQAHHKKSKENEKDNA